MNSSCHSLIPFLPLFCSCQFRRLDSIQFLCSQTHIPAGSRSETRLFTSLNGLNWTLPYNNFERTTQKTQPLYYWEGVFTAPLHSNGSCSTVACIFVAPRICLQSCSLAMDVCSDFKIPVFGCHVTVRLNRIQWLYNNYVAICAVSCRWCALVAITDEVHQQLIYRF
jgi:hypothetical protein